MPNFENINKVIDWLNRGAPEVAFSMTYSNITSKGLPVYEDDTDTFSPTELEKLLNGGCGSVCCIAGAAAQFSGMPPSENPAWSDIQARALEYFGFDHDEDTPWMLPVFDPDYAPSPCSPQFAAQALELWAKYAKEDIAYNPWPEIEE